MIATPAHPAPAAPLCAKDCACANPPASGWVAPDGARYVIVEVEPDVLGVLLPAAAIARSRFYRYEVRACAKA